MGGERSLGSLSGLLLLILAACGGSQPPAAGPAEAKGGSGSGDGKGSDGAEGVQLAFAPQIELGTDFGCWLKADHHVTCWGELEGKQPSGEFQQISAASFHACGVTTQGDVQCWGAHSAAPGGKFAQVSAGDEASCGVRPDGELSCWGATGATDYSDALQKQCQGDEAGDECEDLSLLGMRLVTRRPQGKFKRVTVGGRHACALTFDGTSKCWAPAEADEDEAAGREVDDISLPPGKYRQISAGFMHTCAVKDGSGDSGAVVCVGGVEGQSEAPTSVAKNVAAGVILSCALLPSGKAACWGGDNEKATTPPEGQLFTAVAAGLRLGCGLPEDGDPVCWGETESSAAR